VGAVGCGLFSALVILGLIGAGPPGTREGYLEMLSGMVFVGAATGAVLAAVFAIAVSPRSWLHPSRRVGLVHDSHLRSDHGRGRGGGLSDARAPLSRGRRIQPAGPIMRIAIALIALPLATRLAAGQAGCPVLSGRYIIQGEDGQVRLSIRQHGCQDIVIDRQSNYLEKTSTERDELTLDGAYHATQPWLGGRGTWEMAAHFVPEGLETFARQANEQGRKSSGYRTLYERLRNGDLSVRDWESRTGAYGSGMLAERQPVPLGIATARVQPWPYIHPVTSQDAADVCFNAKDMVNWMMSAYYAFGAASVLQPDHASLKHGYVAETHTATRRYTATVPPSLSTSAWLLLSEAGISPIHFTRLHGEIEYRVDSSMRVLGYPAEKGEACGRVASSTIQGAFVLKTQRASDLRAWSAAPVRVDTTGPKRFTLRFGDTAYVVDRPKDVFEGPKKALLFRGPQYSLLMIVWGKEPCEHQYSLFEPRSGTLFPIQLNSYGCDV